MQAANSIGDFASAYADAYHCDTALTAQLGSEQRVIDQQQRLAEFAQLQAMAQIYGGLRSASSRGAIRPAPRRRADQRHALDAEPVPVTAQTGERAAQAYAAGG